MGRAARRRRPATISRMVATGLSASAIAGIVVALSHEQALAELRTASAIVPEGAALRRELAVLARPATGATAPPDPAGASTDTSMDRGGPADTGATPVLRAVPTAADRDAAPPDGADAAPPSTTASTAARPASGGGAPNQTPARPITPAPGPASDGPQLGSPEPDAPAVPPDTLAVPPAGPPASSDPTTDASAATAALQTTVAPPPPSTTAAPVTTATLESAPPSALAPAPAATTTTAPPPLPTCSGSTCA